MTELRQILQLYVFDWEVFAAGIWQGYISQMYGYLNMNSRLVVHRFADCKRDFLPDVLLQAPYNPIFLACQTAQFYVSSAFIYSFLFSIFAILHTYMS